jgi:ABC-2 type transport system permease protein
VFVLAALLPALAIYAGQRIIGLETNLGRLLLWMFAVSAYGAFWFALAVWVNARNHGAARNALALFIAWIVIVIIVPALGGLLAQTLFPAPTGASIAESERAARFEAEHSVIGPIYRILSEMGDRYPIIEGKEETMERYRRATYTDVIEIPSESATLNRFLRERPEIPRHITAFQLRMIGRQARNASIEEKLAPLLAERHTQQQRQRLLITSASLFSPTPALQKAVSGIAGTDQTRHNRFLDQLDRYIRGLNELFLPRIYRNESARALDFERIKAFGFEEETNAALIRRLMPQFVILTILPLLMGLFAIRAMSHFSAIV